MNESDDKMQLSGPRWKWEWNPNTLLATLTIVGSLIAYGAAWSEVRTSQTITASEISKIWVEIKRLDESDRRFGNLEYRVTNVEGQARDGVIALRETMVMLNTLASDQRVMKSILERIEATLAPPRSRP